MLACIKESCLGIFAATADQRYLLGEDIFLRTHFPIAMRRFRAGKQVSTWTEEDLLRELISEPAESGPGNRTFVLYGAAGSGKSEIIRWLECRLSGNSRRPYTLRISRTELDPVKILQKILSYFKDISLDEAVYHNWEDLRKKPVTLANHLVWSALGKLLPSDKEIIPISYRLRPIIEKNLRLNFSGIDNPSELEGRTPELIALEDLEDLARECSLPLDIDCGQLRFLMARELEKAVLGGYNFVETLKVISYELMASRGIRPLLLIDDLVQSMNIYSTDLLDFFITMEEGSWDIVLGLTPSSFETSKRGREILNRITTLDTFDDRLIKLWLTDEQGNDSYFLDEKNCHLYAEKYLLECKRQGGFSCGGSCARVGSCVALQMGMSKSPSLSPFNPALLARIFRELPRGKGKARYFTTVIGDILRRMLRGEFIGALESYIKREISVDHPDAGVRLVAEAYAPESARKKGTIKIQGKALGIVLGGAEAEFDDVRAAVTDLSSTRSSAPKRESDSGGQEVEIDSTKAAVRDWLENKQVNKELLKGLRLGIAYLCREVTNPCSVMPPNKSRVTSVIKWDETVEGSKMPLALEGVDSFDGIRVPREIGHAAYHLNSVHLKRGSAREVALESALQFEEVYHLLFSAQKFRERLLLRLEGELGLPAEDFAYLLFIILMEVGQGGREIPVPIQEAYPSADLVYPEEMAGGRVTFPQDLARYIRNLFKDWFLIRENIYDGVKILSLQKKYKGADPLLIIADINAEKISPQFTVGEMELKKFVTSIQLTINQLAGSVRGEGAQEERRRLENILEILRELRHPGTHTEIQSLLSIIASSLDLAQPIIPDWQSCQRLRSNIKRSLRPYIGKGDRLRIEGPLDAHRLLVALGDKEKDPDYLAMKELCRFIEMAASRLESSGPGLQAEAERAGVAGHLAATPNWNTSIGPVRQEDKWGMEHLAQLAEYAQEVAAHRNYIRLLEKASPYIDHQLAGEARAVASGLKKLTLLDFPPELLNKIKQALKWCREYNLALDKVLNWDFGGELNEDIILHLRNTYQIIYGERLNKILLDIYEAWQSHLKNLQQLINCLGIAGSGQWDKLNEIIHKREGVLGQGGPEDLVKALCEAGDFMRDLPQLSPIRDYTGQQNKYQWVIDLLLAPHPPEITLNNDCLQDLKDFVQAYPSFAGAIKLKVYLA